MGDNALSARSASDEKRLAVRLGILCLAGLRPAPAQQANVKHVYFESPGTAHEWLTWRRCLNDFAPRLFR
jgi:hypothetical protein